MTFILSLLNYFHSQVIWAVTEVDHKEIDEINILQASMEAMRRSVAKLSVQPTVALIDGPKLPGYNVSHICNIMASHINNIP